MLWSKLFTEAQREVFVWQANTHKFIGPHGEVKAYHQPDTTWDLNEYVMQYRDNKMSWKEIYWKMWARTKIFKWRNCWQYFIPIDTKNSWRYHTEKIKSWIYNNTAVYRWCNSRVQNFDIGISLSEWSQGNSAMTTPRLEDLERSRTPNGWYVCDHIVDAEDFDFFYFNGQLNVYAKTQLAQMFKQDLEYYWKNIELILKDSKMPEIKLTSK